MAERFDVMIQNEACAISLVDGAYLESIASEGEPWKLLPTLASAGHALVMELAQDDSFCARVVVDDELRGDELCWIGRSTAVLEVGDTGAVLAGGFDADTFPDLVATGQSEYCAVIGVPQGHWRVDVYTYITSGNAEACLGVPLEHATARLVEEFEAAGGQDPWPRWLAELCLQGWDNVDEHPLWSDPGDARRDGRLVIDGDRRASIDFLIQLRPAHSEVVITPRNDDGMLSCGAGGRWPDGPLHPPLSDSLEWDEDELDEETGHQLGAEGDDLDQGSDLGWRVDRDGVWAQLEATELTAIGSAVEVAIDQLNLVALITWFIDPSGTPSLAVEAPATVNLPWPWTRAQAPLEGRTGLVFHWHGRAEETQGVIEDIADWIANLPRASRLTLMAVFPDDDEVLLALSGELGTTVWKIDAAAPEIHSDTLASMLELAHWVSKDSPLHAASEEELESIGTLLEGWQRTTGRNVEWHASGLEVSVDAENRADLAAQVFRHRFSEALPALEQVLACEAEVASQLDRIRPGITP
jgi:hypothetical protein